jgi:hypothetical protein
VYENSDGLHACAWWLFLVVSASNDSHGEVLHNDEYHRWPLAVRDFYDRVWRRLFGSAA